MATNSQIEPLQQYDGSQKYLMLLCVLFGVSFCTGAIAGTATPSDGIAAAGGMETGVQWTHAELPAPAGMAVGMPSALGKADLDGDGVEDLIVAYSFRLLVYPGNADGVRPLQPEQRRSGTGRFDPPRAYDVPFTPTLLSSRDVDGDGRADVVASDGQSSVLLRGRVTGTLGTAEAFQPTAALLRQKRDGDRARHLVLDAVTRTATIRRPDVDAPWTTVALAGPPLAALSMDLNGDPVPDLVVLQDGRVAPSLVISAPLRTFTVTSANTLAAFDVNRGDGICADASGQCTLPAAIDEANASPGLDLIRFAIPGPLPILIGNGFGSGNYTVSDPVIIDATTQPGYQGTPVVELVGVNGDAISITSGGSLVRGLAISGYVDTIAVPGGRAIMLSGGGGNVIERNCIGTDTSCARVRGIGNTRGVQVGSSNNIIGGTAPGAGNVIAFSNGLTQDFGVNDANGIGISLADGTGNAVLGNVLFANRGLGIDIIPSFGVTPNDRGDVDGGPNTTQNFPVLTQAIATPGGTRVQGTLNSRANRSYRVEFFSSNACDPSGFGEARRFLAARTLTTNGTGNAAFTFTLPIAVQAGRFVTSTATDPAGNTSELSRCRVVTP